MKVEKDIELLVQTVHALKDSFNMLEQAYAKQDYPEMQKAKESISDLQKKINKILK
jgi:hypothetical protein